MREQVDSLDASVADFDRTISRRNSREVTAAILVALVFGLYAGWGDSMAETIAALAVGVAAVFVGMFILSVGRVRDLTGKTGVELRDAFKSELNRHARLLRLVPLWYAGPLVLSGVAYALTKNSGFVGVVVWLVVGAVIVWLNRRAAKDLTVRAGRVDTLSV